MSKHNITKISGAPIVNGETSRLSGNINYSAVPSVKTQVYQNPDGTWAPVTGHKLNQVMVSQYGANWVRNWTTDIQVEVAKIGVSALTLGEGQAAWKVLSFGIAKNTAKAGITSLGEFIKGDDVKIGKNLMTEFVSLSTLGGSSKITNATGFINKSSALIVNTGYNTKKAFSNFGTIGTIELGKFKHVPGSDKIFKEKIFDGFYFKEPVLTPFSIPKQTEKIFSKKLTGLYKDSKDISSVGADLERYVENWEAKDWVSLNNLVKSGAYSVPEAVIAISELNAKYTTVNPLGAAFGYFEHVKWETQNTWATKQNADEAWHVAGKLWDESVNAYLKSTNSFRQGNIIEGVKNDLISKGYGLATIGVGVWGGVNEFLRGGGEALVTAISGGTSILNKTLTLTDLFLQNAIGKNQPHVYVKRKKDGGFEVIGVNYETDDVRVERGYAKNIKDITSEFTAEEQTQIQILVDHNAIESINPTGYFADGTQAPTWSNVSDPSTDIPVRTENETLEEVVVVAKAKPKTQTDRYGRVWTYKKGKAVSYTYKGETWLYANGVSYQEIRKNGKVVDTIYKSTGDMARALNNNLQQINLKKFNPPKIRK